MRIRFDGKTVEVNGAGHGFGQCDRAACCPLDLRDPCRRCGAVDQIQHLCVAPS